MLTVSAPLLSAFELLHEQLDVVKRTTQGLGELTAYIRTTCALQFSLHRLAFGFAEHSRLLNFALAPISDLPYGEFGCLGSFRPRFQVRHGWNMRIG